MSYLGSGQKNRTFLTKTCVCGRKYGKSCREWASFSFFKCICGVFLVGKPEKLLHELNSGNVVKTIVEGGKVSE